MSLRGIWRLEVHLCTCGGDWSIVGAQGLILSQVEVIEGLVEH